MLAVHVAVCLEFVERRALGDLLDDDVSAFQRDNLHVGLRFTGHYDSLLTRLLRNLATLFTFVLQTCDVELRRTNGLLFESNFYVCTRADCVDYTRVEREITARKRIIASDFSRFSGPYVIVRVSGRQRVCYFMQYGILDVWPRMDVAVMRAENYALVSVHAHTEKSCVRVHVETDRPRLQTMLIQR